MQIHVSPGTPAALGAGVLVVPIFADGRLDGAAKTADAETDGAIADVLASREISGAAGETSLIHSAGSGPKRVLVVGLGQREKFEVAALARYAGTAVRHLGKRNVTSIAFALPFEARHHTREAAAFIVEGALAGTIDATTYRTEPDKPIVLDELTLVAGAGEHTFDPDALRAGAERGRVIGEAVNFARTLALTPANEMTPTHMAAHAEAVAKQLGLAYHALDEEQMAAKGMGAILGVSRGSDEPARMIVLEYTGDPSSSEKLALVGKGLTFDSDQARREHARDEVRHVRRRRRHRRHVRDRATQAEDQRPRGRAVERKSARSARREAGRHPARDERQDDRGDQYRR
jgi:leucyl aminopeptidase